MSRRLRDPNRLAYVRGDKLYLRGRFGDAAKYFLEALEEWPEDWQSMMALANCYSEMHKHSKAESTLIEALECAPQSSHSDLLFNLGNAQFDQGKFAEACKTFERIATDAKIAPAALRNLKLARERSASGT